MKKTALRYFLLLLTAFICLESCSPDFGTKFDSLKKLCDNSTKEKNKETPASKCHSWFPVQTTKETIKETFIPGEQVMVPGETVLVPISIDCDSLSRTLGKNKPGKQIVYVSTPRYVQVDTQQIVKEVQKKDVAEVSMWQTRWEGMVKEKEAIAAQQDIIKNKTKNWQLAAIWTWGILILVLIAGVLLRKFS